MKKIFALISLFLLMSCNDGNFEIASFEFEEEVNYCGTYIMYRLSTLEQKEALIVTLTEQQIKNSDEIVAPVSITATGLYTVTYRLFEEEVTDSYFCSPVPPIEPKTVKNWVGIQGTIFVQNEAVYNDDETEIVAYNHIISINNLVLESGENSMKFDDLYEYGQFETPVE